MRTKQTCTHCLNDHTVSSISFLDDGRCAYCHEYERLSPQLDNFELLRERFRQKLKSPKAKGSHDVLVGISGGKDSTYVLHKLVQEYGQRVMTFTFDNGFMTDWSLQAVEELVKRFGVEHSVLKPPAQKLAGIYRRSLQLTGAPCM
mgnify:CR=1 FL=1